MLTSKHKALKVKTHDTHVVSVIVCSEHINCKFSVTRYASTNSTAAHCGGILQLWATHNASNT